MAREDELKEAWLRVAAFDHMIHLTYPDASKGDAKAIERLRMIWADRNEAFKMLNDLLGDVSAGLH